MGRAVNDILKASFDHVRAVAKKVTAEQMEKKVDLFGHEMTGRNVLITVVNHMHEHLGQSIAYARMNNVVPTYVDRGRAVSREGKTGEVVSTDLPCCHGGVW